MEPKRKKAKAQRNGFLNSSNLNKVDRRFSTATADGEDEERLGPMSAAVKERIIKYKKAGSNTDPFSKESQGIIDELVRVSKQGSANLAEAAFVLDCAMKVFRKQVENTRRDVFKLAEIATRTRKSATTVENEEELTPNPINKKKDRAKKVQEVKSPSETDVNQSVVGNGSSSDSSFTDKSAPVDVPGGAEEEVIQTIPANNNAPELRRNEVDIEWITISDDEDEPVVESSPAVVEQDLTNPPEVEHIPELESAQEIGNEEEEFTNPHEVERVPELEYTQKIGNDGTQSFSESATPEVSVNDNSTKHQNVTTEEACPIARKRLKKDYGPPPQLISCYDPRFQSTYASESDDPPTLTLQVTNRKERRRLNAVEELVPEKHKSPCLSIHSKQGIQEEILPPPSTLMHATDLMEAGEPVEPGSEEPIEQGCDELVEQGSEEHVTPEVAPVADGPHAPTTSAETLLQVNFHRFLLDQGAPGEVPHIKLERVDEGYLCDRIPHAQNLERNLNDSDARGRFTPEDEAKLIKLIQLLHYMPFTSELSKAEVGKAFRELQTIYREHNVPVNTHVVEAADASAHTSSSPALNAIPILDPIVETHELFSQRIGSQGLNVDDASRTIMETTQERTRVQSNSKMQEMLRELQRAIVPKYTNIPLIEENTKDFFCRVNTFANKMKRVLAEEENKEEFDVRKYEMDVLDVTHSEEEEAEAAGGADEESVQGMTPVRALTLPDDPAGHTPLLQFNLDGLPSPSSSEGTGVGGVRWISLKRIFSHMKTLGRQEAARMFYAVLALLSFKNLDIKYDNHYSAESAALVENNRDHHLNSRFPHGAKIMDSRCADVDKEDIYIAALSHKSRTETFRELDFRHHQQDVESRRNSLETRPDEPPKTVRQEPFEEVRRNAAAHFSRELQVDVSAYGPPTPEKETWQTFPKGLLQTVPPVVASNKKKGMKSFPPDMNSRPMASASKRKSRITTKLTGIED